MNGLGGVHGIVVLASYCFSHSLYFGDEEIKAPGGEVTWPN